jgi:hypothetical protein
MVVKEKAGYFKMHFFHRDKQQVTSGMQQCKIDTTGYA